MRMVALLRGINVGGNRKVPMAELRATATRLGLTDIETYIQSGNLVFHPGRMTPEQVASRLEKAIEEDFGFAVEVIVRTTAQWKKYASSNPFLDAARARPNLVLIGLSKRPFAQNAAPELTERATQGER